MATAPSSDNRHRLRLIRPGDDQSPATRGSLVRPLWLWFGILGGPVAFGLARLAESLLITGRCVHPAAGSALIGLAPSQQLMAVVTILAALVAGAAGLVSWHSWRQTRRQTEEESGESLSPAPFWALGGLFLSSVFFILIILTGGLAIGLTITCAS